METIKLKNGAGEEIILNKPTKKALAELALAAKEERKPNLPEQDREDAENFNAWVSKGFKESK